MLELILVGYPAIYGNNTIMQWNQQKPKRNPTHPKLGRITRATTLSLSLGFRMMLPALITLTGYDGRTGSPVLHVLALRAGA